MMNWVAKQWHNAWANYYASKIESLERNEDPYIAEARTYHSKKFISHYEALYGTEQQDQANNDEAMGIF